MPIYVSLKHSVNVVDLGYANTPAQAAHYRERGYILLEELRAMPAEMRQLRALVDDQQRRLDDQVNLIASLRRQLTDLRSN